MASAIQVKQPFSMHVQQQIQKKENANKQASVVLASGWNSLVVILRALCERE